jgi:hypothetical protein
MSSRRLRVLLSACAIIGAAAAIPAAQAQMMVPVPPGGLNVYRYSDAPKADPGDNPANWSARQNVADSDRYERLLRTNPAFRAARIRKECGGFSDPQAYQQCVATFY